MKEGIPIKKTTEKANQKNYTEVQLPDLIAYEHESCSDILLRFYRLLGWNGNDTLEIRKVKLNPSDLIEIINRIAENETKRKEPVSDQEINMFFLHYGPSHDDNVKKGTVWLLDNWVEPPSEGQD